MNRIYLNKNFLPYSLLVKKEEKNNITNILANTLSELTEVNGIKIKVDGQEVDQFKEVYVKK